MARTLEEILAELKQKALNLYDQKEKEIDSFRNTLGDGFIDADQMRDDLRESYEYYYDDLEDYVEELLNNEIIEDTEEFFELDEDGNPDHDLPKFDKDDYKDDYVNHLMDGIDDYIDEYLSNYGYDGIENYIDNDKLAELIVNDWCNACNEW